MTVERVSHSGMLVVYDIVDGYLVKQRYIGYTRKEAVAKFKRYVRLLRSCN